jgi:uncharacterized protein (TIGR00255 family)
MTGYGKGSAEKNNISADVEIKSVNSRYLDISLRLPPLFSNREYEIKEFLKGKIKRGKVAIYASIKNNTIADSFRGINNERLTAYVSFLNEIKKSSGIIEEIKLEHILSNLELLEDTYASASEEEFEVLIEALESALNSFSGMKKKEGTELSNDLEKRVGIIAEKLDSIESESSNAINEQFSKLKDRINLLLSDTSQYSERLELELALIAERADITEECVRLRSHLKFFLESIANDEEPGRKLNFLCQEMNRETNTISSKSISTFITHNTVLIKEEIEKIREQIQNIE